MKLVQLGPNRTQLEFDDGTTVFFSYETPVAAIVDGKPYIVDRFYSKTTSAHISAWLCTSRARKAPPKFFADLAAHRTGGWHG